MFGANATGDRHGSPNVAIILTDGKPTNGTHVSGKDMASQAASLLRNSGVRIVSIGVAQSISVDVLKTISSPPRVKDQDYFTSPDIANIDSILQGIVKNACPTSGTTMHATATLYVDTTTLLQDTTIPDQDTTRPILDTTPIHVATSPIQAATTVIQDTTTPIQDTTRTNLDTTQNQDTTMIQGATSPIQDTTPIQVTTSHSPVTPTVLTPFHDQRECNSKSCQTVLLL